MGNGTDYGKLAWLKAGDLAASIAKLESRKEKEAEKYGTVHGQRSLDVTLVYLTETHLYDIEVKNAGNAAFFFKLRLYNGLEAGSCYIHFYAGGSLIAGGLTDIDQGKRETVFMGGCELPKGTHSVRVRIEGLTGRTLVSADYAVSGFGLTFCAPDNFLSACAGRNNVLYACCGLPGGACMFTGDSGASFRALPVSGALGNTSLTLVERGATDAVRFIIIQNGTLYALEETYAGRVIEESGVTAACACPMNGCDGVFNIIFIKNYKAYCVEAGAEYFCKPAPVMPSVKFKECRAVIKAPAPMFILTDTSGESFLVEAENIQNGPLTVRTLSAVGEAEA